MSIGVSFRAVFACSPDSGTTPRESIGGAEHERAVRRPTFQRAGAEELAVVEDFTNHVVVGLLIEGHLMPRYAEEIDKGRRDLSGEGQGHRASRPGCSSPCERPTRVRLRRSRPPVGCLPESRRQSGQLQFASFKQTRTVAKPVPSVARPFALRGGVNGTMTGESRAVISRGDRGRSGEVR